MTPATTITSTAADLSRTLVAYKEINQRRTWPDIIADEARQISWEMYQELRTIRPYPGGIYAHTIARGFRMGRKGNSLTPALKGVSRAAFNRATVLLDRAPSEYFRVSDSHDGVPVVKPVRFSGRKSRKLLQGGRTGYRFASSAVKASKIERDTLKQRLAENPNIKRLNHRALATAIEAGYRARAARGGTLSVQWLHSVYRRRRSATVKNGPLIARSTAAGKLPIGMVTFTNGPGGQLQSVTLSGLVPGTARVVAARGIMARVYASRIADRTAYINRKLAEAKQEAKAA